MALAWGAMAWGPWNPAPLLPVGLHKVYLLYVIFLIPFVVPFIRGPLPTLTEGFLLTAVALLSSALIPHLTGEPPHNLSPNEETANTTTPPGGDVDLSSPDSAVDASSRAPTLPASTEEPPPLRKVS